MTAADRLRKAIAKCDWLEPAYANVAIRDICAAIVEEFGLTQASVKHASGWGWQERNTKMVRAILDVSEGK